MDVISETLVISIFKYPGAFVRWLFSKLWQSKKKYKDFLNDAPYLNGIIGLLLLVLIVFAIKKIEF